VSIMNVVYGGGLVMFSLVDMQRDSVCTCSLLTISVNWCSWLSEGIEVR